MGSGRRRAGNHRTDTDLRTVEAPPELAGALAKNDLARAQWENLSYTPKKEYAEAILQAKKPETRVRRIQNVLKDLSAKSKQRTWRVRYIVPSKDGGTDPG